MKQSKCRIIGITGGIASGKTTVKNYLRDKNYPVIDSDIIARDATQIDKPPYYEVIEYFGKDIRDTSKAIDRKKLASIIFNNPSERKILEEILYPYIFKEILTQVNEKCSKEKDIIFIDIPLLFENIELITSIGISFDQIWLVYCDKKTQLHRLTIRDKLSTGNANLRINAQMDIEEKKKKSDRILENMTTKEYLFKQIDLCISELEKDQI